MSKKQANTIQGIDGQVAGSPFLYSKNAKVYATGRTERKAEEAIKSIKTAPMTKLLPFDVS
jgi:hypothetical protein